MRSAPPTYSRADPTHPDGPGAGSPTGRLVRPGRGSTAQNGAMSRLSGSVVSAFSRCFIARTPSIIAWWILL